MISRMMTRFVLIILFIAAEITRSKFNDIRDAEINRLLKKLNKPALKSIKLIKFSPDEDIIDCVHMKNHPIYDHPLFKNHTIQMRPSSYPKEWNNKSSDTEKQNTVIQLWTINGKCPKNSIPIRRTKREDILRVGSIERYMKKDSNNIPQSKPTYSTNDNVTHEPYVQTPREFSLAQIWLLAGPNNSQLNSIEFGWQVYEGKYGDANPRYFVYWTKDGYNETGCYNLECDGFVPVNQEFALGAAVHAVSTLGGQQAQFSTTIWKDPHSGHWWLRVNNHIIVGYWPSTLFNHLENSATEVQWGGEIIYPKNSLLHTTTQMGSGNYAQEGWKKASYFRNLEIVDDNNILRPPTGTAYLYMTKENCYNVVSGSHDVWGLYFYYGGPGRNRNCI
ncbi:unnamed protein product [Arabis nemorensis]|uniref:Neprosin PEP catalytic domain-containing protein n=1 Tax=Arabis nemorensis TaxID=586526 RepID=A0A565C498_9BRAS|nr:unnamed protein product [Arabis nemorensis]